MVREQRWNKKVSMATRLGVTGLAILPGSSRRLLSPMSYALGCRPQDVDGRGTCNGFLLGCLQLADVGPGSGRLGGPNPAPRPVPPSQVMPQMGRFNQMTVARETPQGLYLNAGAEQDAILLPNRWVTPYMQVGGRVDVFLYRDSEGRPIATTDLPHVEAGQFACLEVLHVKDGVGAFLDWGLSKDLLLPGSAWAGQRFRVGDRVTVAVFVDGNERVIASCELDRHFPATPPGYAVNDPVDALIYAESPLGWKAVVNQAYSGLLYRADTADTPQTLKVGDEVVAYVKRVYDDGKIDLQRDPSGYGRVDPLVRARFWNGSTRTAAGWRSATRARRKRFARRLTAARKRSSRRWGRCTSSG